MKKMRFSILLLGMTFLMNSCSQPAADQEASVAVSPGNAVAAESVPPPSEGAGGWMDGMPEIIPPFTYGTFSSQSNKFESANGTMYSLYYENVTMEEAREYLGQLKETGFSVNEENGNPGELSASGGLRQGEGNIGYSLPV